MSATIQEEIKIVWEKVDAHTRHSAEFYAEMKTSMSSLQRKIESMERSVMKTEIKQEDIEKRVMKWEEKQEKTEKMLVWIIAGMFFLGFLVLVLFAQ